MRNLTFRALVDRYCNSIDDIVASRGGSVETIIGGAASESEIAAFERRFDIVFRENSKIS